MKLLGKFSYIGACSSGGVPASFADTFPNLDSKANDKLKLLWIAGGKAAPRAEQAKAFLKGVGADGLDPADYPTPAFADPGKFAADELALTQSVITFACHPTIDRHAFSRPVMPGSVAPGSSELAARSEPTIPR